jgi:DNA primase
VWPALGRYECCECGLSGDVIGFVIWAERLNFVNAVRLLCQRAGMAEAEVLRFVDVADRPAPQPQLFAEVSR